MELTKEMFGKTLGDVIDLFNKCQTEEEFKQFYLLYWDIVEEEINKEQKITIGDQRRFDLVYGRVRDNLIYLLGSVNEMQSDYAKKVWWFL